MTGTGGGPRVEGHLIVTEIVVPLMGQGNEALLAGHILKENIRIPHQPNGLLPLMIIIVTDCIS